MSPDYTKQLDAIVAALNHPTTPAWRVAFISATLGFLAGLLSRFFDRFLVEWHERRVMRRVLYVDIANMFLAVEDIMSFKELQGSDLYQWQQEQLKAHLKFPGEAYSNGKQDIFMQ